MKKKLYLIFISFCLVIASCFCVSKNFVFAEANTVTSLSCGLYRLTTDVTPLPNENNIYNLDFNQEYNENNALSDDNTPYGKYIVGVNVSTAPIAYEDIEDINEKQTIFNALSWTINNTPISFENYKFVCDNYILELHTNYSQRINLAITPLQAGNLIVGCSYNGISTQLTIFANYATPSNISLETTDNLVQLFEDYTDITFTTKLNYLKYLDETKSYTYIWKLNGQTLDHSQKTITLTKQMVKIGNLNLSVEVEELPLLNASETIVISTNTNIDISVTSTGGSLQQVLGEDNQPIVFDATVPVTSEYTVSWFLKSPNSNVYKKQSTTTSKYSFEPLEKGVGKYKLFAQVSLNDSSIISEIFVINITPKKVTDKTFTITCKEYNNNATGVTSFACTIDTKDYYSEDDIIWSVNSVQYAKGSSFNFEPSVANEYIISVKLKNNDGSITTPQFAVVKAKSIQKTDIWIYILIAVAALAVICTTSIIVSNKLREKIW